MSFFGLLLIILAIFILQPLIRGFLAVRRYQNQMKSGYRQATSTNGSGASRASRAGGWSGPMRRHRKVITREMGEYVAFEDVAVNATVTEPDGTRNTATIEEEQVIDAEWEEIR